MTHYSEVQVAALAPDGIELAHDDGAGISIVPRVGSTFSATPSLTVPSPTGASEFFGATGALAEAGTLVIGDPESATSGAAFVYTGGATTPGQQLTAVSGEQSFATAVALRADGEELVQGATTPGQLGVFQRGPSGYVRVQTLAAPDRRDQAITGSVCPSRSMERWSHPTSARTSTSSRRSCDASRRSFLQRSCWASPLTARCPCAPSR